MLLILASGGITLIAWLIFGVKRTRTYFGKLFVVVFAFLFIVLVFATTIYPEINRKFQSKRQPSIAISTSQIIELLEQGDLESVSTTHSQAIHIRTKGQKEYHGLYKPQEAERYRHFDDVGNLVHHVVGEKRGLDVHIWE